MQHGCRVWFHLLTTQQNKNYVSYIRSDARIKTYMVHVRTLNGILHLHNSQTKTNFTFLGPCIVIYFYSKTNKMHNISNLFILEQHSTCFGRSLSLRGSAVGWGTALQTGRSRVRFPMVSLDFFHWHNPSGRTMALGLTQPLTEMSTRNVSWG